MNSSNHKSTDQNSELQKFRLYYELIEDETPVRRKRRSKQLK